MVRLGDSHADAGKLRRPLQLLPGRVHRQQHGRGGGWSVDYPRADTNLSIRLSELTKTSISTDTAGEPNHLVVRLTDPDCSSVPSS